MAKLYRILTLAQAENFDFDLVEDFSLNDSRKSLDGNKVVVQYKSEPDVIDSSFYTLDEIHQVIWNTDWYEDINI
jgi:hypothetical protein